MMSRQLASHGPTLFAGLSKSVDFKFASQLECAYLAAASKATPERSLIDREANCRHSSLYGEL
jgi:hypothetical protein